MSTNKKNKIFMSVLNILIATVVFSVVTVLVYESTFIIDPGSCPRFINEEPYGRCYQAAYRTILGYLVGMVISVVFYKNLKLFR